MSFDIDSIFDKAASGGMLLKNPQTLTIDYVPERLPFRGTEENAVAHVLSAIFRNAKPSNLLLFGEPGTGKTAVVRKVLETLNKKSKQFQRPIQAISVNAKGGSTQYKVLFEIAELIGVNNQEDKTTHVPFTGLSIKEANERIIQFMGKKKFSLILVIDEIDSLVDNSDKKKDKDSILYNFTRPDPDKIKTASISIIGISNSLDFKDKLDPRVRSSLSEEEIVFSPYTVEQLRQILQERAKVAFHENAISDAAINLTAAMAGREHGDARLAISLLRVAAEIAERQGSTQVDEKHVRAAQEKIDKDAPYLALHNATLHMKLVILAISKSNDGYTGDVYDVYASLCKQSHQDPLTQRRVTQLINKLDLLGVITTDVVNQGRYGRTQRIRIRVPLLTVKQALKDDATISALID